MSEHELRLLALQEAVKLAGYVGESDVPTIINAADQIFEFLNGKKVNAPAEA